MPATKASEFCRLSAALDKPVGGIRGPGARNKIAHVGFLSKLSAIVLIF
jgi:hypothetical protein